jgi:hypothetical protein
MLLDRKRLTSCIVIEDAEFESGTHSLIVTDPPLRAPDYSNRLTKPGGT